MKWKTMLTTYVKSGEFLKLVKFGITGVANTLVDYLVFTLLTALFGVNLYLAQVCSYSAGMLNSYLVNRSWTFRTKQKFFGGQLLRFIITNGAVLLLSIGLLKVFTEFWSWPVLFAKLAVVCVTLVVNFVISRLWVFRK